MAPGGQLLFRHGLPCSEHPRLSREYFCPSLPTGVGKGQDGLGFVVTDLKKDDEPLIKTKALLTENEYYLATGLTERSRKKCEEQGFLKPSIGSDGSKRYSSEDAELGKALKKYMDVGLPHSDAHEMAIDGLATKKERAAQDKEDERGTIDSSKIVTHPGFEGLLGIEKELLKRITADITAKGYDKLQPVVLATWPGQETRVLIDGHSRLKASEAAGIEQIDYVYRHFDSQRAALEYVMGLQSMRRTTTDDVIFRLIEAYVKLMDQEGDRRSDPAKVLPTGVATPKGRSATAKMIAIMVGCNYKKVEKANKILKAGSAQIKKDVRLGKKTINDAYNLIVKEGKDRKDKEAALEKRKAAEKLLKGDYLSALEALEGSLEDHLNAAVEEYLARLQGKVSRGDSPAQES
jgi:hypothetical protein